MKKALITLFIIILIIILSGMVYLLMQDEEGENVINNFFPVGTVINYFQGQSGSQVIDRQPTDGIRIDVTENFIGTEAAVSRLNQNPISDFKTLQLGESIYIFYLDQQTGHLNVLNTNELNGNPRRITNTTISNTNNFHLNQSGGVVEIIVTNISDVFTGQIPTIEITSEMSITPINLTRQNSSINLITSNENLNQTFYLEDFNSGTVGGTANFNLTNKNELFSSPIRWWQAQLINEGLVALIQPPSSNLETDLYVLNLENRETTRILNKIRGLTVLFNETGDQFIYTNNNDGYMRLFHYNLSTGIITETPFRTTVDKCSWITNRSFVCGVPETVMRGDYPDDWYKGNTDFNDNLWIYNNMESFFRVVNLENKDVKKLHLTENHLFFINKKDNGLYYIRKEDMFLI